MFESTLAKFDKYVDKMEAEEPASFNMLLAMEVQKRLQQLDKLYEDISLRHSRFMKLNFSYYLELESLRKRFPNGSITIEKSEERREMDRLIFDIEMATESFYYFAGRMRTIITHKSKPLPGLQNFECEGARNVRNKLLEHPEGKDSRVLLQSFGVGGEEGPTVKAQREDGQEHIFPDAGLWKNAAEIKQSLEAQLDNMLV